MKGRRKEKDILTHVKRRFYTRWSIILTKELHRQFISQIQNKKDAIYIEKQSNRISIWEIKYKNKNILVVYDKMRKMLVTALPEGADLNKRYSYDF